MRKNQPPPPPLPPPPQWIPPPPPSEASTRSSEAQLSQQAPKKPPKGSKSITSYNNPLLDSNKKVPRQSQSTSTVSSISSKNTYGRKKSTVSVAAFTRSDDMVYHKMQFALIWFYLALFCHIAQFTVLLSASYTVLSPAVFSILLILALCVAALLIASRFFIKKTR